MTHLIDKDVVLAIIENRIRACGNCYILDELTSLHRTFESLEVKEVDYDKALTEYLGNFENASIGHRLSIRRTAKHFFELGMKTSNPLTWEDIKILQEKSSEVFAEVANGNIDYYQIYPTEQSFLKEVLKRFKAQKGE